jgi:hypothetical protein
VPGFLYLQQRNKKIPLSAPSIIRKFLAGFLLLVFAFGITPKRTLHNLIATHKDAQAIKHDHPGTCVSKAVFNCQCENLVAESFFVAEPATGLIAVAFRFAIQNHNYNEPFLSTAIFNRALRGPPAC